MLLAGARGGFVAIIREGVIVVEVHGPCVSVEEANRVGVLRVLSLSEQWELEESDDDSGSAGEFRWDSWTPVGARGDWVGVSIAPEGYLDTAVWLKDKEQAVWWVLEPPTDRSTLRASPGHLVAADDPNDEGGYAHAFLLEAGRISAEGLENDEFM